jgi:DNA repair exonuclease SbcCD ATPase subunit
MSFNYKKFRETVGKKYSKNLDKEVIDDLLNLGDENEYSRDTPVSLGKRLILVNLTIKGQKSNQEIIDFYQQFNPGVNMWIADNLKGKSSMFKVIQFSLTGNNNLKHDIKKWIRKILLNFRINQQAYCVYISLEAAGLIGTLYSAEIASLDEVNSFSESLIFTESGVDKFSQEIQNFFFNQFSYYSLKWTQKSSRKDSDELQESNASWSTYFKSIFLESKDSNSMYGAQEKKIFQMLLGLQLTYPINRLTIKKDMKQFEKAKQVSFSKVRETSKDSERQALKTKISTLEAEINKIRASDSDVDDPDIKQYSEKYEFLIKEISRCNQEYLEKQAQLRASRQEIYEIEIQKQQFEQDLNQINRQILQCTKSINSLQEFLDVGKLFSNLDVKYCPCCNRTVSSKISTSNKDKPECILCHEVVSSPNEVENQTKYLDKIEQLNLEKQHMLKIQAEQEQTLSKLSQEYKMKRSLLLNAQGQQDESSIFILKEELAQLEDSLYQRRNRFVVPNQDLENLISQKAVAEFQLEQLDVSQHYIEDNSLGDQISLLDFAISTLKVKRYELGGKVLKDLSDLMLEELNLLGLGSITEINISEDFNISYKQDDDFVTFDRIAEGEQLRVKIAFYLSLIQLDVKYNFGKHTRFLIIDSPSKEEGDSAYLEGLSILLQSIETRLKDELQIFVGTAERSLSGIVTSETLLKKGDFLF